MAVGRNSHWGTLSPTNDAFCRKLERTLLASMQAQEEPHARRGLLLHGVLSA
jgi:hypothetical protein